MNAHPSGAQSNIYLGGANNNSNIYLRGVTNFPNEASPAYPGIYRSAFFDSTGVFESTFGAIGGTLYVGAGLSSTGSSSTANIYIGDAMNVHPSGAQSNIYLGGAGNTSQIYLRGITNFPNEANPAYPGAYRSTFFDSTGVFESTFGATGGNLYFGAGFSSVSSTGTANIYIGDAMNAHPSGAQSNIYLGGANEIGLIANDVELIMPELVSINKDGTKSLDYPKIVAPLIKAIQQITARLSVLENK